MFSWNRLKSTSIVSVLLGFFSSTLEILNSTAIDFLFRVEIVEPDSMREDPPRARKVLLFTCLRKIVLTLIVVW